MAARPNLTDAFGVRRNLVGADSCSGHDLAAATTALAAMTNLGDFCGNLAPAGFSSSSLIAAATEAVTAAAGYNASSQSRFLLYYRRVLTARPDRWVNRVRIAMNNGVYRRVSAEVTADVADIAVNNPAAPYFVGLMAACMLRAGADLWYIHGP